LKVIEGVINITFDHFDPFIGAISETAQILHQMSSGVQSKTLALQGIHTYLILAIIELICANSRYLLNYVRSAEGVQGISAKDLVYTNTDRNTLAVSSVTSFKIPLCSCSFHDVPLAPQISGFSGVQRLRISAPAYPRV
jgi:hypothetical protein